MHPDGITQLGKFPCINLRWYLQVSFQNETFQWVLRSITDFDRASSLKSSLVFGSYFKCGLTFIIVCGSCLILHSLEVTWSLDGNCPIFNWELSTFCMEIGSFVSFSWIKEVVTFFTGVVLFFYENSLIIIWVLLKGIHWSSLVCA